MIISSSKTLKTTTRTVLNPSELDGQHEVRLTWSLVQPCWMVWVSLPRLIPFTVDEMDDEAFQGDERLFPGPA